MVVIVLLKQVVQFSDEQIVGVMVNFCCCGIYNVIKVVMYEFFGGIGVFVVVVVIIVFIVLVGVDGMNKVVVVVVVVVGVGVVVVI